VHPGVIDEDFKRKIDIMSYIKKSMQFKAGDRIAQLLLLPYVKVKAVPI
jgi:dUTPase